MAHCVIQGLWSGDVLSAMETLSISSFIKNGHEYHLYAYNDLNAPPGTILKDANQIVRFEKVFRDTERGTFATFSNIFRYKLLAEKGGYWADTDVVCLKPFEFDSEYVFGEEMNQDGSTMIAIGVLKAPAGSPAIEFCYESSSGRPSRDIKWGEIGPQFFHEVAGRFGLRQWTLPHEVFYPVDWYDWKSLISDHGETQTRVREQIASDTHAVHLWNEMWRLEAADKNGNYHQDCLYERMKRQFLE